MTKPLACLCGNTSLTPIASPTFGERKLYHCSQCSMAQLYPWPSFDINLEDIYQDEDYMSKISETEYYGYFKSMEEHIRVDLGLSKDIKLLDFGAGYCNYQRFFLKDGYKEAHSLEINPHLVRYAKEKLGLDNVYENADELVPGSYDIVIANQVFEHLANPIEMLQTTIAQLLKPGGVMVFAVPNWDSLNRPILRTRWLGYSPDDHIWFFSKGSANYLLPQLTKYDLVDMSVKSACGKSYDGFNPDSIVKRLYYKTFWRFFEKIGRGDQLMVTVRKKA